MLKPEPHLQILSFLPKRATRKPPLLFVHGGYCDAWCWSPFFLPWFAAQGYPAHALSLRGHGESAGRDAMFLTGLDDYVADVERVAAGLPAPPVLIGHSMGAAIVERMLATRPVDAAALLAPIPPAGLFSVATRLAASHPDYLMQMARLDGAQVASDVLATIKPFYFSDNAAPHIVAEAVDHLNGESPRALLDLSLRLHWTPQQRAGSRLLVLGAQADRISTPDDAHATARHHGVDAVILPGLAHMLMLEPEWERAARVIAKWLAIKA
jgi:non-heme chloroperoxidase